MTHDIENESKRDRFRRLATLRTNNVLNRLRVLGNCANQNNYKYTTDEVDKIFNKIEEELGLIKAKFKKSDRNRFEL